jgi:DcmR-like sensory protein
MNLEAVVGDWRDLLDQPDPEVHFVQLYSDDRALARNVGRYLAAGVEQGDCAIAITTPAHRVAFREAIQSRGVDVASAEQDGKLLFLDAEQILSRFMVGGLPQWQRFETCIARAVRSMNNHTGKPLRAYGEMVGILWTSGEYSAAIQLEEFWNRIIGTLGASLFCSYPIDVFGPEFDRNGVHAILCDHTHLLPGTDDQLLSVSIRRAMNEVLGKATGEMNPDIEEGCPPEWGSVPPAEVMLLALRQRFPEFAAEIIDRARRYSGEHTLSCAS